MKKGLARVAAGVLALALLSGTVFARSNTISWNKIENLAADYNISQDFVNDVYNAEYDGKVDVDEFQRIAQEHTVKSEYLQRFFNDCFVYRRNGTIHYDPVDTSLLRHDYDLESLEGSGSEIRDYYFEDGTRAARGVDVSRYQGNIDWNRVKADGIDFAIVRVGSRGYTKGAIMLDAMAEKNIQGAIDAGIEVGVYFFSQAVDEWEAIEEANAVLDVIRGYDITYPVIYDMEEVNGTNVRTKNLGSRQWTDNAIAFCDTVSQAGYHPMVYTYTNMYITKTDLARLEPYDKWVAQYYRVPFFPYDFQMLQYSCTGKVDGIAGPVDLNVSFKNY